MKFKLNERLPAKKILILLSFLSVASAAIVSTIGEMFVPLAAAVLSLIFVFDNGERIQLSWIISGLVAVCALVLGYIIGGTLNMWGFAIVFLAWVIAYSVRRGKAKGECAFYLTAICTVFILITFASFAMLYEGEFSFAAVTDYYGALCDILRTNFVDAFTSAFTAMPTDDLAVEITPELAVTAFDVFISLLVSVVILIAFLMAGVTLKLFSLFAGKLADDAGEISEWHFSTSNVFAYAYLFAFVVSAFATGEGMFAITVANLYNVLLFVYAYIGIKIAFSMLSHKRSTFFAIIVIGIALVAFYSLAMQILSVLGVVSVFIVNRGGWKKPDDGI